MNKNPPINSRPYGRSPNESPSDAYRANKLYGREAERKARLAIEWHWLYTAEGSVYRRTRNGKELRLTPFEMNGRPHIRTFFMEHELLLPLERVADLEREVLQGPPATKDMEPSAKLPSDVTQSERVDAVQENFDGYETPWGETDWR